MIRGIAPGADGNIWFTEYGGNQIGSLTPPAPPSISLSVSYGSQRTVTLSGQVTDVDAGGLTVTFTGMVTGSTVTNPDGTFSATFTATGLGEVDASTTDSQGLESNVATVTLTSNPPVITNFMATAGQAGVWTFTGTVTDESPAGLVVTFGGLPSLANQMATVQSNGSFELSVVLQAGEEGTATAVTTDWWGLMSNEAIFVVGTLNLDQPVACPRRGGKGRPLSPPYLQRVKDGRPRKITTLAHRVGQGDKDAALAFQAELEPGLTRIVHRVLRGRCRNPALQARILTEVSEVSKQLLHGRSTSSSTDQKEVAAQVARSICTSIVEELRTEPGRCTAVCDTLAG